MQGPVGEERHQKESDGSHDKGAVHGDGGETFHYFRTAFAPVLGAQKDHDVPHSPDHLLKDKLDLVHRGDTGESRLRVVPEHHVVRKVHTEDYGLLQHERHRELQEGPVKVSVFREHGLPPFLRSGPMIAPGRRRSKAPGEKRLPRLRAWGTMASEREEGAA